MRYLYVVLAVIFVLSGSALAASNNGGEKSAPVQSQEKEIVTDLNENRSDDKEYGVNNEREMPQSDTYDQNTGLPNVVASDKTGELE